MKFDSNVDTKDEERESERRGANKQSYKLVKCAKKEIELNRKQKSVFNVSK